MIKIHNYKVFSGTKNRSLITTISLVWILLIHLFDVKRVFDLRYSFSDELCNSTTQILTNRQIKGVKI